MKSLAGRASKHASCQADFCLKVCCGAGADLKNKKPGLLRIQALCGRWDLNPHDVTTTRSLVLLVCQFRHFRVSGVPRFHISHRRILIYHSSICLASTFFKFFYFFNSIFILLNLYYILSHGTAEIRPRNHLHSKSHLKDIIP